MSASSAAPTGAGLDYKTVLVKVQSKATNQLAFLKALAIKLSTAAKSAIITGINFAKRTWSAMPANVSGSLVASLTATKQGYLTVTGMVRTAISFITNTITTAAIIVHNSIDKIGAIVSSFVKSIHAPTGDLMHDANAKFTEIRYDVANFAYRNLSGLGTLFKHAFNNPITIRSTTFASVMVGFGLASNALTHGAIVTFASSLPVVGAILASALSGGIATALFIVSVAMFSAAFTLFYKRDEIIAEAINESIDKIAASTAIIDIVANVATVSVEGNVTPEQAKVVANAAIEQEVAKVERSLAKDFPNVKPGPRNNYPARTQSKKRK